MLINYFVYCVVLFQTVTSERRIKDGKTIDAVKPYMAYLVKAPPSPQKYDFWLCGGAIVTKWFIVTSAACVSDVKHLYAIVGYNRYVTPDQLNTDPCTKNMKKKIILTCVPKSYELDYHKIVKWSWIDIGVVKVESPFGFNDPKFDKLCSHRPKSISINYSEKYQEPGTDALVLGWGHADVWRQPSDIANYNQEFLQYAPILIMKKEVCLEAYAEVPNLNKTIRDYMICADGMGNINAKGEQILRGEPTAEGCGSSRTKLHGKDLCEEAVMNSEPKFVKVSNNSEINPSRRLYLGLALEAGICQNDHGGPLVTWVGSKEVLIGVASVFRVNEESKCTGPYLFASTQCNGAFLGCVLNDTLTRRSGICEKPSIERGFDIVEKKISWKAHPDGPAENERFQMRPQLPIRNFRG